MNAKIKNFFLNLIPTKRRLIQLYAALLYNANIKGFINGSIFKGDSKAVCVPGLNCYSCPGAIGACPLGSIQNALADSKKRYPSYVLGIILLYSIILGRTICGFLCPVGLVQELLYKIKTPKLKKNRVTRILSYFKYILLAVLVIALPLIYALQSKGIAVPAFCKYICPAGVFEGAFSILSHPENATEFLGLGKLFTWKFCLLICFLVASVFIFRFFCRFFCPLGALYGLFNRFSIIGVEVDKSKCNHCNACISKCKMDVLEVGDHECINCGECKKTCPCNAISWKKICKKVKKELHEEKIETKENEVVEVDNKKSKRINIIVSSILMAILVVTFGIVNFAPKPTNVEYSETSPYTKDIPLINYEGTFNIEDYKGKVIILNFWYINCGSCRDELPHFNSLYEEYKDSIEMIAINSLDQDDPEAIAEFIEDWWPDFTLKFGYDDIDSSCYNAFNGKGGFPKTVIIDKTGKVVLNVETELSEEQLRSEIEKYINE